MNPFQMPRGFCIAQTFLIYYAAYSLTGVCAAFTFATAGSVLWPSSLFTTASSTLIWRKSYYLPILGFPLASIAAAVPVLLRYNAIQPTDDMHCDASHPIWGRFLGYAGITMLVSIPCFFLSAAAAYRVFRMHLNQQRSGERFKFSGEISGGVQTSRLGRSKSTNTLEFTSPLSSPHTKIPPSDDVDMDSGMHGTVVRSMDEETGETDDAHESCSPSHSRFPPSPIFASSSPSHTMSPRSAGQVFRWDMPKRGFDPTLETRVGSDIGHRPTNSLPLSADIEGISRGSQRHAPRSLAPAIWRLILFQMAFFIIQCLAALSTIIDVASNATTPTPFGTQHVALILAGWGPSFVFGHLPAVRRQLMFWRRPE
ncbi:hypothetical protein BV22DRAFT_1009497 [Leucogyrophana mollusca]|uniref:Uncharacterized protein n=1 Tax=Leucogyrophana mollusca TaxID=85980 RepID=A0ACB8BLP8_9AGAM|nr:hypothetical protein BV22DRAFT_1009497 [Leucogyrophana mollusca]